jgi:hypothetical protein
MEMMIEPEAVVASLKEAGFKNAQHHLVLGCFSEYSGDK